MTPKGRKKILSVESLNGELCFAPFASNLSYTGTGTYLPVWIRIRIWS